MTPTEQRNSLLAQTLIKNLNRRHIEACYCPTAAEAAATVLSLIPDGSSVTWGGTMTIRDMDIPQMLRERSTLEVLDRDLVTDAKEKQEMYLRAFTADVFLSSANALSEDGVIVNIDGNGNRVAAITWGPKKVIFVVGLNKVAPTVEAAVAPCKIDGVCHNCTSPDSICSYIHLLRNNRIPGRFTVVLVGESLGY